MRTKELRVLLAERSSSGIAQTLREVFPTPENELDLTVVSTVATLLSTIQVTDPEIILVDLALNFRDPYDAVRLVQQSAPGVPLVVIADPAERRRAAQSLTEGAMDYLLKGLIDQRTLGRVLRGALERNTLEGLADLLRDPMTGLYTREGFLTMGARCQQESRHTGGSLVLLCAQIENLGTLRSEANMTAVNQAISDAARVLTGCCRRTDLVARIGEGEFAMLAIDAIAPTTSVLKQRLEKHLEIHNLTHSMESALRLHMNAGAWAKEDARSFSEFLECVEAGISACDAAHLATQHSESRAHRQRS